MHKRPDNEIYIGKFIKQIQKIVILKIEIK